MATYYGDSGNDYLVGTVLDDYIDGRAGNDTLIGRAGNDTLIGGAGDDLLEGGRGNDTLTGGMGSDTFVLYYIGGGIDRITDFSVKEDFISLTVPLHTDNIFFTFGDLRYNAKDGALFFDEKQIAWLPTNLIWEDVFLLDILTNSSEQLSYEIDLG